MAQPGAPLYGIQQTNDGKVVIFGGGLPIVIGKAIVGAVGASAGTVDQDIAVAEAAAAAVADAPSSESPAASRTSTAPIS